jgi:hypothetical protein
MKKNIILSTICAMILLSSVSCTSDFENINADWKNPTTASAGQLFNGMISLMRQTADEQLYLNNEIFYPESELGALTSDEWNKSFYGTESIWSNYYCFLSNVRDLEYYFDAECKETGDTAICDIARAEVIVLKAYQTFKLTDIFGDLPYFDAGMVWLSPDEDKYVHPAFDSQEDIYKSLLNELVWARDILNESGTQTPSGNEYLSLGGYDALLYGNQSKWGKLANSLILRHALRCYDKAPDFAGPILVEAYYKPIIDDMTGVCLWPKSLGYKTSSGWAFRQQNKLRMGTTVWQNMSSDDDTLGTGIYDYRAYLFFDTNNGDTSQVNMGNWVPFPQERNGETDGGKPYSTVRSDDYSAKGDGCHYSPFNYYMVEDEDYIPEIIMTYADALFMKAEVAARGIVNVSIIEIGNNLFEQGIYWSFVFWTQMPSDAAIWNYKYPAYLQLVSSTDIWSACTNMSSKVSLASFTKYGFPTTAAAYLPLIYEQRWINLMRQPWEAWALARQTHATPTSTDYKSLKSNRLEYPPCEAANNVEAYNTQIASMQFGDSRKTKIWWMK